ncbi:adenine phosphoribosyltransferase [Parasphingorhabdus pacifica]
MSDAVRVLDPTIQDAVGLIREVPDFPSPGVLFRDIGPMLANGDALGSLAEGLGRDGDFDVVAGVEARGFLLGAAVARSFGTGVVGLRKPGKLPAVADEVDYDLEYGSSTLQLPSESLEPGQRVLVVDDVLATGGTLGAACELVRRSGAKVSAAAVVLELSALAGRESLSDETLRVLLAV